MTAHTPDEDRVAALVRDAVSDVEPGDRLGELRSRTTHTPGPRRWWAAAGGAALATAAVVTAIAVVGTDPSPTTDPGPAGSPTSSATEETPSGPPATDPTTAGTPAPDEQHAVPAYFISETPEGPRLYREFQTVADPSPGLAGLALLESGAVDPDYETLWPVGSFRLNGVSDPEAGVVVVSLGEGAPAEPSQLAVQQVVYTLSAGFQEPLEVHFERGGDIVARATAAPQLDVLSRVNLSDPTEGALVGDSLRVTGRANAFEATVGWTISRGEEVVDEGYFTAEGYMAPRLFPFAGDIDVSSLDPGTYTLTVESGDASGGAEGVGSVTDTRTFVIE